TAVGVATGVAAMSSPAGAADAPGASPLPMVTLGSHQITRLIIGGNPIYGYSHFNKHFDRHLTTWHTSDRVMELWKRCEQGGLNTFQNSYAERTLSDVDRYRAEGGT